MAKKAAFITIGQTPRIDMVPEMAAMIDNDLDIMEWGALDGLSRAEIADLRPGDNDHRLVTRLSDGGEAVIKKSWVRQRLQSLLDELEKNDFFVTVLLCTGHFGHFRTHGLFLEAQTLVDHGVEAIAESAQSIAIMVPLAKQIEEFHYRQKPGQKLIYSHASPYTPGRLEEAAQELLVQEADLIVMHCMGYTEAMRRRVAAVAGKPVLLARRMVAGAVAQLL